VYKSPGLLFLDINMKASYLLFSPGLLSLKVLFLFFWANDDTGSFFGLRTPNEGIIQRNMKIWANVADKICFGHT
jgi:hypothetical protein